MWLKATWQNKLSREKIEDKDKLNPQTIRRPNKVREGVYEEREILNLIIANKIIDFYEH